MQTSREMRHRFRATYAALSLLALGTGCGDGASSDGTAPSETAHDAVHGPIPSLLARVVEGPSGDHALCEARVRGAPAASGGYRATLTLAIPGVAPIQHTGAVSAAVPTFDDGTLAAELLESPPGSGETLIKATMRQPFASTSMDEHRCTALIEADSDNDASFETELMSSRASASLIDQAGQIADANSIRVAGQHLVC